MPEGMSTTVAQVVEEALKEKKELEVADFANIASAVAKEFKVSANEVAILALTPDGKQLRFLVPQKLAKIGSIPMTSTNALAVRTARDRRPDMINNFASAKHATVFEAVSVGEKGEKGAEPIQKILSVPILLEGKTAGVIQVSRKGKTPGAAGPDFTPKDLQELVGTATVVAKCFKKA